MKSVTFINKIYLRLILIMVLSGSAAASEIEENGLLIIQSEGGSDSTRVTERFTSYLSQNNCKLKTHTAAMLEPQHLENQNLPLLFVPIESKAVALNLQLLAKAGSVGKGLTQSAIIVRNSAPDKLDSLANTHISFVTRKSLTGFSDQIKMLQDDDVAIDQHKLLFSGNHVGALSLLLHKDAFVAGIDYFLAERWLASNGLKTIAKGPARTTGGIYLNQSAKIKDIANYEGCIDALTKLESTQRKHKRLMKVFPDWLTSFSPVE